MPALSEAQLVRSRVVSSADAAAYLDTFLAENECSATVAEHVAQAAAALRRLQGLPTTPAQIATLRGEALGAGGGEQKKRKREGNAPVEGAQSKTPVARSNAGAKRGSDAKPKKAITPAAASAQLGAAPAGAAESVKVKKKKKKKTGQEAGQAG